MNILAIDTSTKKANVCLKYNNNILDKSIDNEITHSEKLLPLVDEILKEAKIKLNQIDYLACSLGPGSFTGIRIGIATIKAFAKVLNTPIFAISSLDMLAYTCSPHDYVISIMDAKNTRIYYSIYKVKKISPSSDCPYLERVYDYSNDTIDVALDKISSFFSTKSLDEKSNVAIVGDCIDVYKNNFSQALSNIFSNVTTSNADLSSETLVSIVENYLDSNVSEGHIYNYLSLDAIYVRPSQAERAKNNEL